MVGLAQVARPSPNSTRGSTGYWSNTCIEHLRRQARRPQTRLPDEPDIADRDTLAGLVDKDAIGRSLERLRPEHRAVVVLRYWADLPIDAIAERLDVPGGTVRSRLHYALDALRTELESERID